MRNDNYKLTQYSISAVLNLVQKDQIAIPQMQRPFVWKPKQIMELIDSLYEGYPIGYLIVWQNSSVKLKNGTKSAGKKILIDGQQRITALMATVLGQEILDDNYQKRKVKIAFCPCAKSGEAKFAVYDKNIAKDPKWIPDISEIFKRDFAYRRFENEYIEKNPEVDPKILDQSITKLKEIANNEVGVVELSFLLDIDIVTEIFIRINSQGKPLNQEDFAMSKISVNEELEGDLLQKSMDHFCHLALEPEFGRIIEEKDKEFLSTQFGKNIYWMTKNPEKLFVPTYGDILKTVLAAKFGKSKVAELVNMLSGKNSLTKEVSEEYATETFLKLKEGIIAYMSEENFMGYMKLLKKIGILNEKMTASRSVLNYTYAIYLMISENKEISPEKRESLTARWYTLNTITGRYITGQDSAIAKDYNGMKEQGIERYLLALEHSLLTLHFWKETLPSKLQTGTARSPYYATYLAALCYMEEKAFLNPGKTVKELLEAQADHTQIFAKSYLQKNGITNKELYGQVANSIYMEKEVKSYLKRKTPMEYMADIRKCCQEGKEVAGQTLTIEECESTWKANCIPMETETMKVKEFRKFLALRRGLMSQKIESYYNSL